jgi:hypothetical protein
MSLVRCPRERAYGVQIGDRIRGLEILEVDDEPTIVAVSEYPTDRVGGM